MLDTGHGSGGLLGRVFRRAEHGVPPVGARLLLRAARQHFGERARPPAPRARHRRRRVVVARLRDLRRRLDEARERGRRPAPVVLEARVEEVERRIGERVVHRLELGGRDRRRRHRHGARRTVHRPLRLLRGRSLLLIGRREAGERLRPEGGVRGRE